MIDPCLDGVGPGSEFVHGEGRRPEIIYECFDRCGMPITIIFVAKEQTSGDVVMPIGKDRRSDGNGIAKGAFGGITAATYLWLNIFDDNALAAFNRFHSTQFQKH